MSDDTVSASRRDRLDARRRRLRWASVVCAVMIVGGAATAAAFTLTDEAGTIEDPPSAESEEPTTGKSFTEDDLPELSEFTAEQQTRPLSYEDPLRVWVGGDSLAGALGPALGNFNDSTGVVETTVDFKISSGLASQVRNWPKYAPDALEDADPEVVVFMIGTNDATIVNSQDRDDDGVPDWETDYRAKVANMMDMFLENDRVVLWIGAPTMRDDDRDEGAVEVNRVMRSEALKRSPDVVYVDAYRIFAGGNGGYTQTLENKEGDTIRVRIDDGVHFTAKGAEHLASAVFALLDARFDVLAQADPEHAQEYKVVSGSGGSGSGSSGSGGNRRPTSTTVPHSTGTTPPTSETPPTTSAPTASTTPPTTPETSPPTTPVTEPPTPPTTT